ncbi:hypothetical protein CYLTODRAFT_453076 [Cylindrobasidium torrendii FP15055 ss-10]|uniref:Uncharacterized protein n=1 Tax=Cylindrobasidium torrendii FP15055 ss-10 TaxID=1314674 RepID=A0A0D7BFQ3_9AGAR|nr:hypothetical protein CYLTODRAFT_453076 [Cylindrobasidium torrendii FP15055 ss-10]
MAPTYLPKHISLYPIFKDPIKVSLFNAEAINVATKRQHAVGMGLTEDGLTSFLNTIQPIEVQPGMENSLRSSMTFSPRDDNKIMAAIIELYTHNYDCNTRDELKQYNQLFLEEITGRLVASLAAMSKAGPRRFSIYLAHPITGAVSEHSAPFHTLPDFKMPFVHPCAMAVTANDFRQRRFEDRELSTSNLDLLIESRHPGHPLVRHHLAIESEVESQIRRRKRRQSEGKENGSSRPSKRRRAVLGQSSSVNGFLGSSSSNNGRQP